MISKTFCLINGLPDEIAIMCLARLPLYLHPKLRLVCHSWEACLRSTELLKVRREVAASEELICILAFEPENTWQLYDPRRDLWMTLPVMPSSIRHLARFGVATVAAKLFVIGGGSDRVDPLTGDHDGIFATNEVWSYDPLLRQWTRRAPMLFRRALFACCVVDGKIVVAGGFTNCRISTSKAEIYDPEADTWNPLPDLQQTHSSPCTGVVLGEKMHVLHNGSSTVQILEGSGERRWAVEDYGWLQGPMAVIRGVLYVMTNGLIMKQQTGSLPDEVMLPASEFQNRIGFGMIGVGDEIYMVGGVIGPGPRNECIKQLSDVDVLDLRSERPAWRAVAPMTRCRGSVLGCTLLRI